MNAPASQALVEHEPTQAPMVQTEGTSDSAAIFQIIARLASNPNADPDKIERFLAMRDRELDRMAVQAFNAAMVAAQGEMPQVVRNAKNTQTNSLYAKYETISEAIQPIITKHGFACMFSEGKADQPNHIRTLCDVVHEAGHTKQFYADIPFDNVGMKGNANKTNTHAYGSTKSYGKRYLKCEIFDVAVKNQDDDGNAGGGETMEMVTTEQRDALLQLIHDCDMPVEKFCEWAKVEAVSDLLARHFDKAVSVLQQRKAKAS